MFKPFSPENLKAEASDFAETKVVPGEKWHRWDLDELRRARMKPDPLSEEAKQGFIRDAELNALREKARQEAWEQGHKEGSDSGYQAGYEQGLKAAKAEVEAEKQASIDSALMPVRQLAEAFSAAVEGIDKNISEELVELALAVGAQLARDSLDETPETVLKIVRELIHSEPTFTNKPRLFVNPEDFALIEEHLHDELHAAGWKLVSDERLTRGGCRLVSQSGERDATWEARWEQVRAQVRQRNGNSET
ncbi:flagellar biosynthesis/type III secretory pathway protein [Idiomarina sp. A28L]|uniref:flagellar assembly protein FliH n=1 Tax=Idiomarina sp. A28L TaxID=1036674 RepID=UPI0002138BFF|nr:flagellar assembly protein FliH [Idiomarina sp. A28L]EGN75979.1 flagellar biosynthesis/type III secretory pathway protein [Idiomarina sp. A28L]